MRQVLKQYPGGLSRYYPTEWSTRIAQLAVNSNGDSDPRDLRERRRRISRAYPEGAFSDAEYDAQLAEVDSLLRQTDDAYLPTIEEAAELYENIPKLWAEATPEERRLLLSPLIERVYIDVDTKLIGAVTPVPAFRSPLEEALRRDQDSAVVLLSNKEMGDLKVWSWWRRGRVDLYYERDLSILLAA